MTGCESTGGNTLLDDFILVGRKLEELGFTYYEGKVTVAAPSEEK